MIFKIPWEGWCGSYWWIYIGFGWWDKCYIGEDLRLLSTCGTSFLKRELPPFTTVKDTRPPFFIELWGSPVKCEVTASGIASDVGSWDDIGWRIQNNGIPGEQYELAFSPDLYHGSIYWSPFASEPPSQIIYRNWREWFCWQVQKCWGESSAI